MQENKEKNPSLATMLIFYILIAFIMAFPSLASFYISGNFREWFIYSQSFAIIVAISSARWLGIARAAGLLIGLIIIYIMIWPIIWFFDLPGVLETSYKSDCSTIATALWRYAEDHDGQYPLTTDILFEDRYLDCHPANNIAGKKVNYAEIKDVPFGSEPFEGNFTYIPVSEGEVIFGYYFIGYGYDHRNGMDVNGDGIDDHVIILFDSRSVENYYTGQNRQTTGIEPGASEYVLPPLADLLQPHVQDAHDTD
ncbi:MAG: hypothetical protein NTY09_07370 [bacterium]|nr:hypothetical protein [bacterium]